MATVSQKYQTLIELAPDPIFLIDPASASVVEVNTRACELLEYERDALEGTDVTALHPSDRDGAYRSLLERTIAEGVLRTTTLADGSQIYLLTRSGERIPVELHARSIDVDGESWIYTIARDVTERYERERRLRQEKERFEKFAGVVSHDLRNPLNVANGRMELAREDCDSEHLEEVAEALDRMGSLIDDLLELASGGDQEREWIDLAAFGRDCWRSVEAAGVSTSFETDQTVWADRSRLKQLFENLMRNAVEHGSDDGTITVGALEDGFYVADDGPGIPPSERDRVFELGYSSSDGGTGFGLAIVEQIATEHGWEIRVTDGENGGARFEITGVETK
jgi:PAS domain S-box-containing protein